MQVYVPPVLEGSSYCACVKHAALLDFSRNFLVVLPYCRARKGRFWGTCAATGYDICRTRLGHTNCLCVSRPACPHTFEGTYSIKPTIIHRSAPKKPGRRRLRYGRVGLLTHASNTWHCLTSRATYYHTTPPLEQPEISEISPCGWMRHRGAGLMTYDEQPSWLAPRALLEITCPVTPEVFDRRLGISLRWTAPPGQSPTTRTARGLESAPSACLALSST
jgi:hypothetical protein